MFLPCMMMLSGKVVSARYHFASANVGCQLRYRSTKRYQTVPNRAVRFVIFDIMRSVLRHVQLLSIALCAAAPLVGQGRNYGRSMVISQQGIVATSQVLASQAGAQILARGGSAVDAAIAANAVLAVTEPLMDGLGGDMFAIYWDAKTGKLTGLNGSGPAPQGLSPAFLTKQGLKRMPGEGINSVTVPGAVDGWWKMHERFGKLPWKELFGAAIGYAEQGFPVPEGMYEIWGTQQTVKELKSNDEAARVFLPAGKPPQLGE